MSPTSNIENLSGLDEVLGVVCSRPELELEWLDLLSQLEYVGCRKILKALPFDEVDLEVLRHVSEEASHAFLLKSVAERLGLTSRSWREGRFAHVGWEYFRRLDAEVALLEQQVQVRYPAVSWAIERRVLAVYPRYAELTRYPQVTRVLHRILAQEQRHGAQFEEARLPPGLKEKVLEIEQPLWWEFVSGMRLLSGLAERASNPFLKEIGCELPPQLS